jgi:hypothetical protein
VVGNMENSMIELRRYAQLIAEDVESVDRASDPWSRRV